jgi:hypothetical protein
MFVFPKNLPHNIEYLDDNTRVRKTGYASKHETVLGMQVICNDLIKKPDPTVVPVYAFDDCGRQTSGIYKYTYDMQTLRNITSYEKKIIRVAADDFLERGIFPSESHSETIVCARKSYLTLIEFLEKVMQLNRYDDINDGNIMMDYDGNYRLIDLESFLHFRLERNICEPIAS